MIDVKQAVANAAKFLKETFGEDAVREPRLEEVELSEDDKYWHITLSFLKRGYVRSPATEVRIMAGGGDEPREYKQFEVNAEDGTVRSMKIRQLT